MILRRLRTKSLIIVKQVLQIGKKLKNSVKNKKSPKLAVRGTVAKTCNGLKQIKLFNCDGVYSILQKKSSEKDKIFNKRTKTNEKME